MMRRCVLVLVAASAACSAGATVGAGGIDSGSNEIDSPPPIDAAALDAEVLGPFGAPQQITTAATGLLEDDGTLSFSGLELVFAVVDAADSNRKDLFYASRPDLQSPFGGATKLAFSTTGTTEETPRFSGDDLTLFFAKTNGANGIDVHQVTRPAAGSQSWGTPQLVDVNSTATDKWFSPCAGNRYLMIVGGDIAEGTLGDGPPAVVPELSSAQSETGTFVTQDCLTVYFASNRPDAVKTQLYRATRPALAAPWKTPVLITDFATLGGDQQDPWISPDERTFVFVSNVSGTNDLYISTR
ncbi:MAG: hypothetical protein H6Q90_4812 [Deltaproteobacteria bacterium]|nr:hypothetical protein [Deltaproteobacteria bacterium]